MNFIIEYDKNGNHRLGIEFPGGKTVGEWASYSGPAFIQDQGRIFAAHTDFDTRFPLVYEVKPVTETIIITNCGEETWRGTCDQSANRSPIKEHE